MRICIVTPAPPGSTTGNRVTARRWAGIFRALGHRAAIVQAYAGQPADLLVALHAEKSHASVEQFHRARPRAPIVVTLTGTDVYGDIRRSRRARRSLELATRLVALQPLAVARLPPAYRRKLRVVHQSARPPKGAVRHRRWFDVCVLAHLRRIKDPFRAAEAARRLPASSRIRVWHLGAALEPGMAARARREERRNPRYRWLGNVPRGRALRLLAGSRLLALTSRLEGGANVVSEALACSVPVLSSRIAGSIGLLGRAYPGYFPVGDTAALCDLLERAEADPRFYTRLKAACRRRKPLVTPGRERRRWAALLGELSGRS